MRVLSGAVVAWLLVSATVSLAQPARKLNVAHRGASAYAPEHTLAAYRLALEQGADFVEQDLAVTKDGVLICLHDPSLERTTDVEDRFPTRFTEVTYEGKKRRAWLANDFTLAEIKTLDAGSWFGPTFAGERVPRLGEELRIRHGNGTFGKWLLQVAKTDVLLLDNWGMAALDSRTRADLLEIIDDRAASRATIITSQLPIEHWHAWVVEVGVSSFSVQ